MHKDWDGDGQTTDPSDGFGLLLNGTSLGYIQLSYSHTDSAVTSPNASEYMIKHGEEVKICVQNLARWTPQLRNLSQTILASAPGSDLSQPILDSVKLADQLLNGVDTDGDKAIEPIPDECGMISAYGYAYSMANMPLLPISLTGTSTATTTSTSTALTAGATSGSSRNTPVPSTPTSKPPNTKKPPTNTPRPTKIK
jgi:hypothetical protein